MILSESHSVMSNSLWPQGLHNPWNSPDQNTGVGSRSLLHRIFPTQGSNPGLPHGRWILYQLSHHGSPRILEWVPYPFFSGSFWLRNQTGVSCIAGGFFTSWATREERKCQVKMLWLQKISLLQADKILLTKCYLIWAPKSLMRLLKEQLFDL